jgi:NAD-dependent SIR2 family protein deacetylase
MEHVSREQGPAMAALIELARASRRLVVLTGAGCSTESGIPDYRDEHGDWKRSRPVQLREFLDDVDVRRRYWARSFAGWPVVAAARPNAAHEALARLEHEGPLDCLITQNVDGLHQRAGSRRVIDLHGRLDEVQCRRCASIQSRALLQARLAALNPGSSVAGALPAPDGDADLPADHAAAFVVPDCDDCGGLLKPSVVFFGESVPRERVEDALESVRNADAMLVAGSSLMVWSGYRFVRLAHERGLPVAIVNLGITRAEDFATVRVHGRCGDVLCALADAILRPQFSVADPLPAY